MTMVSSKPAFRQADTVPDNVPVDRIVNYDLFAHGSDEGDFALSRLELRSSDIPSVFWTPYNGGHWVVTRAADIDVVLNDAETFGSHYLRVPKEMNSQPPMRPIQINPPDHTKYRALLMGAFSPPAVKKLGQKAQELSKGLIEGLVERGECEFVAEYARIMPIGIFMSMVDLPPEDREHLLHIADLVLRAGLVAERATGFALLKQYITDKVEERRANPGTDLISHLLASQIDGEPLDGESLEGMLILLMVAGLDTVASMLTSFARFLALNPEHRQQLIDNPALIQGATEELLRRFAIVNLGRCVSNDVEIGGVTMKAGDMVVAPTPLSNLDEDKITDPLVVDFTRRASPNATFGGQVHRCMGSMLARTELRIFLEDWLPRIPHFTIKEGSSVVATADITSIIPELHLVWDPAANAASVAAKAQEPNSAQ